MKKLFLTGVLLAGLASGGVGCRRAAPPEIEAWPEPAALSGSRALDEASRFVALGPREAGTPGAERAAVYLSERLQSLGIETRVDAFTAPTPDGTQTFRNVIGRLPGRTEGTVILVSHYDTKPGIAPDFAGANDSGSSSGLLLELARVLRGKRGGPQIEFLFVDGEECRVAYGARDGLTGSRHRAGQLKASGESGRVRAVIVLDMIGDRDLRVNLPRNGDSRLSLAVFAAAEGEGVRARFGLARGGVLDDHVPFLEAGMPAVDLIDFEYGEGPGDNRYWHTPKDTMDKLSADSLEKVGRVVLRLLRNPA
jgi:glutaminyl-peptide cyclotransferase